MTKNIYGLNKVCVDITAYVIKGNNRITVAVTEQYASLITGMRFEGMVWSGIYSDTYIEITGAVRFDNTYISLKGGAAKLCTKVTNSANTDFDGEIEVVSDDKHHTAKAFVEAGTSKDMEIGVDVKGLPRWSYRKPQMIDVSVKCRDNDDNLCECTFKTGLREITMAEKRILVDDMPTFFAGAGAEYYSPTIAALTDQEIIRGRYRALQEYGFNFYRFHTHVPTEEELCIADEMGIMVCVEFGLISNFNKTTPFDKGLEMFQYFIQQTRQHPSLIIYCLGNEGSQLMAESHIERNRAKLGYQVIKENTDNQLGIIAFGIQGELPELENDFESPHLWSEDFIWAYDGLTDIPWEYLEKTVSKKPCIMHEFGKFCVWPSREEEEACTVPGGIRPNYGRQCYKWMQRSGLSELELRLLANSRKAANIFTQIALEDARRQPYNSGYILWCFFRTGWRSRGLSDDLGKHTNGEPERFKMGANADVAILMDRGFQNRAFPCGVEQNIKITLSNFGEKDLRGSLHISVLCGRQIIAEKTVEKSLHIGATEQAAEMVFSVPTVYSGKKLKLSAAFVSEGCVAAKNEWDLWAFDISADYERRVLLHVDNLTVFRALKKVFPKAYRLSSVDSIVIGCRSWKYPQPAVTAEGEKDTLIIANVYDDVIKECIEKGCKVLLIDSESLPEEWMVPPVRKELGERDASRFFSSFRTGWDKGNLVTLVEADPLLGSFPQDGFCDLHFYDMVQSARVLQKEKVEDIFGNRAERIISSFSKIPVAARDKIVVQDPNAIKEQVLPADDRVLFNAREQGYFLKMSDKLAICTLKITDNPAGIMLLKEVVGALS